MLKSDAFENGYKLSTLYGQNKRFVSGYIKKNFFFENYTENRIRRSQMFPR